MNRTHLIGNAHLDPVWLWRGREGFSEILATFRSALDRMNEFPDFTFTSACAAYYEWVEQVDPDMFEEILQRVREGRWCIVGGWYLQPDCNAPGGESFARHALIAQRYFREKFGITAKTGYNVDSFGHNASIPMLLRQSGMENYVFMRPMPHENPALHDLFDWRSPDGSTVRCYRIPQFYNITADRLNVLDDIIRSSQQQPRMAFYGVGNHGGGPAVQDELQHHARGCYSTKAASSAPTAPRSTRCWPQNRSAHCPTPSPAKTIIPRRSCKGHGKTCSSTSSTTYSAAARSRAPMPTPTASTARRSPSPGRRSLPR